MKGFSSPGCDCGDSRVDRLRAVVVLLVTTDAALAAVLSEGDLAVLAAAEERLLDVDLVGGLPVGLELSDDVVMVVSPVDQGSSAVNTTILAALSGGKSGEDCGEGNDNGGDLNHFECFVW